CRGGGPTRLAGRDARYGRCGELPHPLPLETRIRFHRCRDNPHRHGACGNPVRSPDRQRASERERSEARLTPCCYLPREEDDALLLASPVAALSSLYCHDPATEIFRDP